MPSGAFDRQALCGGIEMTSNELKPMKSHDGKSELLNAESCSIHEPHLPHSSNTKPLALMTWTDD